MRPIVLSLAVVLLLVSSSVSVGCSPVLAPVYSPNTHAGISPSGHAYPPEAVEQAILRAMATKGWRPLERGAGFVRGEVSAGGHQAVVRVVFNAGGWRIDYESSSPGLKYGQDSRHGEIIHRRYNHWIRLLDEAISRELKAVTYLPPPAPAPAPVVVVPPPAPPPEPTPAPAPAPAP